MNLLNNVIAFLGIGSFIFMALYFLNELRILKRDAQLGKELKRKQELEDEYKEMAKDLNDESLESLVERANLRKRNHTEH